MFQQVKSVERAEFEGRTAREFAQPATKNPYRKWGGVHASALHEAWLRGWRAQRREELKTRAANRAAEAEVASWPTS